MRRSLKLVILLVSLLFSNIASAQIDTLRIATYNLLRFPSANGNGRLEHFRTVIRNLQPDILVVQELESQAALLTLLNEVMNKSGASYFAAPFSDGPDTDNGLFLKSGKA
ncbi:hypothetical protein IH879_16080, partial [candidate division KSB1 bacterium]|nr:hypothetical protein [candidate division KSB1 bacterium]